jgi:hypothetical protein
LTSRPDSLVCPICEVGDLYLSGRASVCCRSCGAFLEGKMLEALRQITALADALGTHACEECKHPEMRLLPDGARHCPACGSEVLPLKASGAPDQLQVNSSPSGPRRPGNKMRALLGMQCSGGASPSFPRSTHDYAALAKSEPTPNGR